MSIFKPKPMNQKKRYQRAILFGVPFSIVLGIALYYVGVFTRSFSFSIVYILAGYAMGLFIKHVSHGAGSRFAILAVALYVVSILIADVFFGAILNGYSIIVALQHYLRRMLDFRSILSVLFRILGAVVAYQQAN